MPRDFVIARNTEPGSSLPSPWQRIALTLRPIDLSPMTHHMECVARLAAPLAKISRPDVS